jgi:radical SAM protein with 4Fe4S-binding SPASM domain
MQEIPLSTHEVCCLLRDIYKLRPRKVVFTGGEPLLRDDLVEIAFFFKSLDKQNRICLCLTTNGILINSNNALSLVKAFDEIRISIDGFEEINDELRGQGSYKKAMNALHQILRAGGNPIAFITVTSKNIITLKEFLSFLLHEGIYCLHLSQLNLTGRAFGKSELACDIEEVTRTVTEFWHEKFGLTLQSKVNGNWNNCGVGRYITVYPDGSVYPCHLLAFPELCVGNVRENSLYSSFRNSELLNRLRNLNFCKIASEDECFQKLMKHSSYSCIGRFAQEDEIRKKLMNALNGDTPTTIFHLV